MAESADIAAAEIEALEVAVATNPGGPEFAILAEAYRRAGRIDDARRVAVAGLAIEPDNTAGRLALGLTLLDLGEPAAARYELERAMGTIASHPSIPSDPMRDSEVTFAGDVVLGSDSDVFAEPEFNTVALSSDDNAIGDDELDAAFAGAESVPDEMLDANRIAAQAMIESELDEPEGFALEEAEAFEPGAEEFQLAEARVFETETMARLLAEQGDVQGATAIRERLQLRVSQAPLAMDAASVPLEDEFAIGGDPFGLENSSAASTFETPLSAHSEHERVLATLETWLGNLQRNRA